MKKSVAFLLSLLCTCYVLTTFVSCDPNRGEDDYQPYYEDDGPDSVTMEVE